MPCDVQQLEASAVRPALDGPMRRRFGSVEVDLVDDGTQIVATVVPMAVDPAKLQLDRTPGDIVVLDVLAPFPVHIDKRTNLVLAEQVPLPANAWPLVAGLRVRNGAAESVIVEIGAGRVSVRDPACAPDRVPPPPPRESTPMKPQFFLIPGLAVAALAALVAAIVRARATRA